MIQPENGQGWLVWLKRWISGEATRHDEAALDRHARQDPFVAEALEGYRQWPDDDHQARLDRMRSQLPQYQRRLRTVIWIYIGRAAAVLVLAVGAWFLWQPDAGLFEKQMATTQRTDESPATAGIPADSILEESTATTEAEIDLPSENESAAPQPTAPAPTPGGAVSADARNQASDDSAALAARSQPAPADADLLEPIPAAPLRAPDAGVPAIVEEVLQGVAKEKTATGQSAEPQVIRGRVLDASSNDPLIGASVAVAGTAKGTITDLDGNFELTLTAGNFEVVASYTGFASHSVIVDSADPLLIRLQPAAGALEEVLVTSRKRAGRKDIKQAAAADSATASPEPAGGWKKWERYLRRHTKFPVAAQEAGISGEVTLQFTVGADGRPTNIRVEKPLAYGCTEEAIRLLQDGPDWQPAGSAQVHIPFGK